MRRTQIHTAGDNYEQHDTFDSITALGEHIAELNEQHPLRVKYADAENSSRNGGKSFNGGMSLDTATATATAGGNWLEGIEGMQAMALDADKRTQQTRAKFENSVQGARVSIPRYLAGNPRNMIRTRNAKAPKKVLKMGIDIASTSDTKAHEIKNRGIALLSAIESLENSGYSVELYALARMTTPYVNRVKGVKGSFHSVNYKCEVKIKSAKARLMLSDLAFPLAHAAYSRRLMFSLLETSSAYELTEHGYGRVSQSPDSSYDVFIKGISDGGYESTPRALDTLNKLIAPQLKA